MHHKAPRSCSTTCIAKHFRSRGSSSTWLPRGEGRGEGRGEPVGKGQRVRRVRWPLIDSSPRASCPSSATCSTYGTSLPTFSRHPSVRSPLRRYPQLCSLFAPSCSSADQRNRMNAEFRISRFFFPRRVVRAVRASVSFSLSNDRYVFNQNSRSIKWSINTGT